MPLDLCHPTAPHEKLKLPEWYVSSLMMDRALDAICRRVKKFDRNLLPLASAAHPAVEEHHRRPRAMLDNLDAAPQRRPEYRGHRHSGDRVPAASAGFLEKTKLLDRRARRGSHGVKRCRRKTTTDRRLDRITRPRRGSNAGVGLACGVGKSGRGGAWGKPTLPGGRAGAPTALGICRVVLPMRADEAR